MALPIYVAPSIPYYRAQLFNVKLGLLLAAGIVLAGYFGESMAQLIPVVQLKRIFGVALLGISVRLIFWPQ